MSVQETFQISTEAAESYESQFVPAFFTECAGVFVDYSGAGSRGSVADVACGTGIVARTIAERRGDAAGLVGLDLNEAMLAIARRVAPAIEWRHADALRLPLEDRSVDHALCQMALMFMADKVAAITELGRVSRGGVAVCVPGAIDRQPAYGPFMEIAIRLAGPEAKGLLGTYWSCGDPADLADWFEAAGVQDVETSARIVTMRCPSVDALVATEVESTPLIARIDTETYDRIKAETREALDPFTTSSGSVEAPIEVQMVRGRAL